MPTVTVLGSFALHVASEINGNVQEVPGMAGISFTNAGALKKATTVKAALDAGSIHLFTDDLTPTANTLKADFEGAEADFKGYAEVTGAWSDPLSEAGGGASIRQFAQFDYDSAAVSGAASNRIAGMWVEDADGDVWFYNVFSSVITVEADGQGVPLLLIDTEGVSG